MELKEGMYVRTKDGIGKIIDKVNDINGYYYGCWSCRSGGHSNEEG